MNEYLITIKQFSEKYHLSINRVKKLTRTKELPNFKLGYRIVRIITDYDAFINSLPNYLTIKETAWQLGVSYVTVDRYISGRTFKTVLLKNKNGCYLQHIEKSEIIELINKGYDF